MEKISNHMQTRHITSAWLTGFLRNYIPTSQEAQTRTRMACHQYHSALSQRILLPGLFIFDRSLLGYPVQVLTTYQLIDASYFRLAIDLTLNTDKQTRTTSGVAFLVSLSTASARQWHRVWLRLPVRARQFMTRVNEGMTRPRFERLATM